VGVVHGGDAGDDHRLPRAVASVGATPATVPARVAPEDRQVVQGGAAEHRGRDGVAPGEGVDGHQVALLARPRGIEDVPGSDDEAGSDLEAGADRLATGVEDPSQ
jgi:hypothetical protein